MKLLLIGLNHRSAPVEVRERLAVSKSALAEFCRALLAATPLREVVVLSTCNRVEFYGVAADAAAASLALRRFLCAQRQVPDSVVEQLYERQDADCAQHLFEVAAGLDSMVLGETEILGQVKEAYQAAQAAGATGMALNRLFQKTLAAAKQVRSQTAITRGSTSVGSVAVDLAEKIFRDLRTRSVMVLGTGAMSETTTRALHSRGVRRIVVVSRIPERAQVFCDELGARAISYEQWEREFTAVDIIISATAAPHPIVTRAKLEPYMKLRRFRPLFLIDIAVPRDVERGCGDLDNVFLYDIDDLQQIANENRAAREREIAACRAILATHCARYMAWFVQNQAALQQRYGVAETAA